jgi:hypothetical protein
MDYDVFREEMAIRYPTYGHALWVPNPAGLYPAVEVGDVGFIREGKFHRLFNIFLPENHPSHANFGVPAHHKPLELRFRAHIYPSFLSRNHFCSRGVTLVSDLDRIRATG